MPKSVEDIIVPERRRSIRDIPIPEGRKRISKLVEEFHHNKEAQDPIKVARDVFSTPPPIERRHHKFASGSKKGLWVAMTVAVVILLFAFLSLFNSSNFSYVPKSQVLTFNNQPFTADKSGEDSLIFSIIKLSKDVGTDVPATGSQTVTRKASGTIVVYNNASAQPQELIATTRFQTPNGLVYRVAEDITIPGKKIVDGVSQPGSVEVVVYADEGGEKYNIGLNDFTLPGLAGTARFSTIYARSKTPMSGGFTGEEKVVSETDTLQAKTQMENILKNDLAQDAFAQVPEDFVMIPSLSTVTFETLPQTTALAEGSARVNMRGNLSGVMFKKTDLATALADGQVSLSPTELVTIPDLNSLTLTFAGSLPNDLASLDEIKFTVSGSGTLVWRTDEVALKIDLAGKSNRDLPSILNNYPAIVSATPVIRPFWKSTFPDDASRITIKQLPIK